MWLATVSCGGTLGGPHYVVVSEERKKQIELLAKAGTIYSGCCARRPLDVDIELLSSDVVSVDTLRESMSYVMCALSVP